MMPELDWTDLDVLGRALSDFPFYTESALKIKTKSSEISPFVLNYPQRYAHEKISRQRQEQRRVRAIFLKARQEGISTMVAGRYFRRCSMLPNQRAVVIADLMHRAGTLFGIYQRYDKFLPPPIAPIKSADARGKHLIYDSKKKDLPGLGSEIIVSTAGDKAAGRGETSQMLHASELAFWPDAEDVWIGLAQSIPDFDSEVIIESTANGVGGLFHEMWTAAIEGENEYLPIFLPWFIMPDYTLVASREELNAIIESKDEYEREAQDEGFEFEGKQHLLTPEQLAWRRHKIANDLRGEERLFRQEFPSTADEAFLVSGACFFDEDAIKDYRAQSFAAPIRAEIQERDHGVLLPKNSRGPLRVWRLPSRSGRYCIFADPAEGKLVARERMGFAGSDSEKGGRDFSSAHVFDVEENRYVAAYHARVTPDVFAEALKNLGFLYSVAIPYEPSTRVPALLAVERNSVGMTVLAYLRDKWRYPHLYIHRRPNRRKRKLEQELGWITNQETRRPMLDDFAAAVANGDVIITDPDLLREMLVFVLPPDGKPEAEHGAHDDRVMSAAGALAISSHVPGFATPLPQPIQAYNTPTGMDLTGYSDALPAELDADLEEEIELILAGGAPTDWWQNLDE